MQDADALSRASASVSLSSCAFIIRRKKSCVNTLRGGVNYAAVMPCTWQAMRGGTHRLCSLLGNIPNPLTIFQIGCATFRRLFVIFRCSGCPADILIACTRQQYGILFRVRYGLGEIVLSLYIGYGSSISRHYFLIRTVFYRLQFEHDSHGAKSKDHFDPLI